MLLEDVDDVADAVVDLLVQLAYLAQLHQRRAFVGVRALVVRALEGLL